MESKTILFHSNEEKRCNEFLDGKVSLILSGNSKDDKWLGTGMYFWDNKGNANWWNRRQKIRHPSKQYKVVRVNADTGRVLDLTDFEVYKKTKDIWENLCKIIKQDPDVPLGNKLNTLFSIYSDWNEAYNVLKVYGKYKGTPANGIFKFDYESNEAEPTIAVKCIYNIKNAGCILEKEGVKEESNE